MVICAKSGGFYAQNKAKIQIDGSELSVEFNHNGHLRGLHIVIMDPENGSIAVAQCFDTYKTSIYLEELIDKDVPNGYIVIAACKDDCVTQMS